jgi:hypothetical protein
VNGPVTVNGGSLVIQNTALNGTINLASTAKLTTLVKGKTANTDGQIQVFNGPSAGAAVGGGTLGPTVVVTESGGGLVTFNTAGGTYTTPTSGTAQVQAVGANVTMNAGSGTIVLNKGTLVKADPVGAHELVENEEFVVDTDDEDTMVLDAKASL